MFWIFGAKKEIERVKEETKQSFESVKKDMQGVGSWIKHLENNNSAIKQDILDIKTNLSTIKDEIEQLKEVISISQQTGVLSKNQQVLKQRQTAVGKQGGVYAVQTAVQTGVQTAVFDSFSTTEKAIVMILLQSELKLSYDDLAAMLGKERSTIRGQINLIKQKSEGLVEEIIEKNGKKRVFIPDQMREELLKIVKVRVNKDKKTPRFEEK